MKVKTTKADDKVLEEKMWDKIITNEKNNKFKVGSTLTLDYKRNKRLEYNFYIVIEDIKVENLIKKENQDNSPQNNSKQIPELFESGDIVKKEETETNNSHQVNPIIPDGQLKAENRNKIESGKSLEVGNPAPDDILIKDNSVPEKVVQKEEVEHE